MDDQSLRDAFTAASRRVPVSREACPTPDALQELATSSGDAPPRLAMLQHVATCGACRSDFDLLRTANQAAPAPVARRAPRWLPSLAAAVLLATAGTIVLKNPPSDDVTRGSARDGTLRMIMVNSTPDAVDLVWHAVPDAVRYRVDVMLRDGSVAFTTETADTVARGARRPGDIARWAVTATMLDGTERSTTVRDGDVPTRSR